MMVDDLCHLIQRNLLVGLFASLKNGEQQSVKFLMIYWSVQSTKLSQFMVEARSNLIVVGLYYSKDHNRDCPDRKHPSRN